MPRAKHPSRTREPTPISLEGYYAHFDVEECLTFVARALERAGGVSEHKMPEQLYRLYDDLHRPLDEWALAKMLDYWDYDLEKLVSRGQPHNKREPAKPRIDVQIEMTSKGNLKAEWYPTGWDRFGRSSPDTDFRWFYRQDHRHISYDSRPSNELFFLRGAQNALYDLTASRSAFSPVAHPLLGACSKVVKRLKARLEQHFDVTMLSDLYVTWTERDVGDWSSEARIVTFEIDDPAIRQSQAELAELEALESTMGFSEAAVVAAREALDKSAAGPPQNPYALQQRVTKELKRQGLPATPKKVERALYLIDRHRPIQLRADQTATVLTFPRP